MAVPDKSIDPRLLASAQAEFSARGYIKAEKDKRSKILCWIEIPLPDCTVFSQTEKWIFEDDRRGSYDHKNRGDILSRLF